MTKKNQFSVKFVIVALAVGLFSPSVSVKSVEGVKHTALGGYDVQVSVFNTAEAKRKAKRKARRKGNRKGNRNRNVRRNKNVNVNVNRGGGRYYGGGNYRRNTGAAVAAGMVVGAAVATRRSY